MTALILVLMSLCCQQSADSGDQLPQWASAADEDRLFVVKTDDFPTHIAAVEALLPAVKRKVVDWAAKNWGDGCRSTIDAIPLEDFRRHIYHDQETIYRGRIDYDAQRAQRLHADHDDFYRGYMRVEITDEFCADIEPQLSQIRLKNRLSVTLLGSILLFGLLGVLWLRLSMGRVTRGLYVARIRWIAWGLMLLLLAVCYGVYCLLF